MQNKKEVFDYEALKKKTLEQFRSGKDLFSKGGAFAPLLKEFLQAALQAELDEHLEGEDAEQQNRGAGTASPATAKLSLTQFILHSHKS